MGELARRRDARDIWIARGHLHAAVAFGLFAVAAAFALGHQMGSANQRADMRTGAFVEGVAGSDLVALLARVDASDDLDGGVASLTFPDQLAVAGDVIGADPVPSGRFTVEAGRYESGEQARAVRDHLRAGGLSAWVGVERVAGRLQYRVGVGGFSVRDDADQAISEVALVLSSLGDQADAPRVVPH